MANMPAAAPAQFRIQKPYYPIVYVRGYAMRQIDREETFNDTYYGFSATSVEKRQAPPPQFVEADLFEGQLIRFLKLKDYSYADSVNRGLESFTANPSRSLWISRFYDQDYVREDLRKIEDHAEDVRQLVCTTIPTRLKHCGVDLGSNDADFKVVLVAHSMGGLVCRALIQNILPSRQQDPKRWIHRLVTMATPHRGIELSRIPQFLQNLVATKLNPYDANIFEETRMRDYLKLQDRDYDVHSLGPQDTPYAFPVKRCLSLIGSDYQSYTQVKQLTGDFSDGLVKQDRAYIVAGPRPRGATQYPEVQRSYFANVHRAHSGYRGIVNSYESYENIHRFLFGDTRAEISLDNISITGALPPGNDVYFYDFEFLFSIRKTSSYLHRRQQDPCENAIRLRRQDIPGTLLLHTAFMNSRLRDDGDQFSHFAGKFRVVEHRVSEGYLWDHEYPERPIYNETVEVRVGDLSGAPADHADYRWLSDGDSWTSVPIGASGIFRFPLRSAGAVSGDVLVTAQPWPDPALTRD
jgi:hypothetical protein